MEDMHRNEHYTQILSIPCIPAPSRRSWQFTTIESHPVMDAGYHGPMTMGSRLATWFSNAARDLPWRSDPPDPYHVLVSELMLQQTRVAQVIPKFRAFIHRFPTLEHLAAADEAEVVSAWSGLGYYRRARQLLETARRVVAGPGVLPHTADRLKELPGIGPYTAAAVASLAFGSEEPLLDGNVLRVAARVLACKGEARSAAARGRFLAWVGSLMNDTPPRVVNEALMELGATVCIPRRPRCDLCPLRGDCAAFREGRAEDYPAPLRRRTVEEESWVAACAVGEDGRWLLKRVEEGPILRGLWLPPWCISAPGEEEESVARASELLPEALQPAGIGDVVQHAITYRRIWVQPVVFVYEPGVIEENNWALADPMAPRLPTSSLLRKLVASVKNLNQETWEGGEEDAVSN